MQKLKKHEAEKQLEEKLLEGLNPAFWDALGTIAAS